MGDPIGSTRYGHPAGHLFYRKLGHRRPKIARAQGIFLYDEDGKRYIDGSGGPLVVNVGHGRPEIVAAMQTQAANAAYVHAIMFTNEPAEAYAAAMAAHMPFSAPRFYFLSSGSEVVEAGIKLARQVQLARGQNERTIIVSRWQSYHGMTLGALASSGRPGLRAPFLPMMHDMVHIKPPYPYRDPTTGRVAANRLLAAVQAYGADRIAAFLAEPISGASLGAVAPPDDYWPRIREICDRYGILLIADEVLVGMGRTGRWWAIDHWKVAPDILVTSKGAAGGYIPFGFLAVRGELVELIRNQIGDFNHGGTFSHHPVGCAAALATLKIIERENLVEKARERGAYLGQALQDALAGHRHVGDIRGRGLFWGIEFVEDKGSRRPFPAERHLAWTLWQAAFARGLVLYYSQGCADGAAGDLIMVGPPLVVTRSAIDEIVAILQAAINDVLG